MNQVQGTERSAAYNAAFIIRGTIIQFFDIPVVYVECRSHKCINHQRVCPDQHICHGVYDCPGLFYFFVDNFHQSLLEYSEFDFDFPNRVVDNVHQFLVSLTDVLLYSIFNIVDKSLVNPTLNPKFFVKYSDYFRFIYFLHITVYDFHPFINFFFFSPRIDFDLIIIIGFQDSRLIRIYYAYTIIVLLIHSKYFLYHCLIFES
ncbi:hypothetical protein HHX47_DHR2000120 [Lentinula edodes]|nr:hypothetical protein HHX47_DHR2000120 [Lentinula edodes]